MKHDVTDSSRTRVVMTKSKLFPDEPAAHVSDIVRYKELAQNMLHSQDADTKLAINESYAKKYEHNKRREEIQRLESKYGNASDSSSYSSDSEDVEEDEVGDILTPEVDAQVLKTIARIRSKDDTIYSKDSVFFTEQQQPKIEKRTSAPMTLKQYHNQQILNNIIGSDSDTEDAKLLAEEREQQALVQAFHNADQGVDADQEDFLKQKIKTEEDVKREQEEYQTFLLESLAQEASASRSMKQWLQYKGTRSSNNSEPSENQDDEAFLINYILGKGWIDQNSDSYFPGFIDASRNDKDDDEHVELSEAFEAAYNFRYEQEGSSSLVHYPRDVQGSVRKEAENSRRKKRQVSKEKKELEKKKEEEELKRLKNLKKSELERKINRLKKVGGLKGDIKSISNLLEGDDDDFLNKYDQTTRDLFNEEYYEEDDAQDLKEWEGCDVDVEESHVKEDDEKENQIRDEYYNLHYEDKAGDVKTRFKYRQVRPSSYGLDIEDILLADDKELNAHVSLKKLHAYRPDQDQEKDEKRYGKKRRVYEIKQAMSHNKPE